MPDLAITRLDDLAVIAVRGPDALHFLQGQVSQDLQPLTQGVSLLAGLHNPQGRCVALLRLLPIADDHLLAVLPGDIADATRTLLSRYVLRAKVKVEDANAGWRVYGVTGPDAQLAASTRLSMPMDATGLRQLIVAPRGEAVPDGDGTSRASWRLDDIIAGLPEIGAATSGLFVAQMLNLDLLGAIAFDKGCYTGQEVIARAHYRGHVKRRMQRFITPDDAQLHAGTRVRLDDGRTAQVVMSAPAEEQGQQFLAVTTPPVSADDTVTSVLAADDAASLGDAHTTLRVLPFLQLPLPYPPAA